MNGNEGHVLAAFVNTWQNPKGRLYENATALIGYIQYAGGMGHGRRGPGGSTTYRLIRGWRQAGKLFYLFEYRHLGINRVCAFIHRGGWTEIPRRHCPWRNGGVSLG